MADGRVLAALALPVAGIMSDKSWEQVLSRVRCCRCRRTQFRLQALESFYDSRLYWLSGRA